MNKIEKRLRRKKGIRKNIYGTAEKPRITVFRSNKHIYVQAIDDRNGATIEYSSDFEAKVKKNIDGAAAVGEKLAGKLVKKKIKEAVYDRNGYIYHGVVKALADGVRKGGIKL
jgi:large subunit ribosomal protein L18